MSAPFRIVWPQRVVLTGRTVRMWYGDAVANGELDDADTKLTSLEAQFAALSRAGVVTAHRDSKVGSHEPGACFCVVCQGRT